LSGTVQTVERANQGSRRARWTALGLAAVVLVCWGAWARVLSLGFTDVDTPALILTGRVHSWSDFEDVVAQPLLQGRMVNARFWRPITSLSYGLDERLWGLDPFGFHLTDLLLHTACALLLWQLVVLLWRSWWPDVQGQSEGRAVATLSALLFAVHPVHVENVPAIARRAELLVGLGALLALLATWRRLHGGGRLAAVAAAVACALGIGAKEAGFGIPLLCLLLALTLPPREPDGGIRRAAVVTAPLFAVAALLLGLRTLVLGGLGGYGVAGFPLGRRALLSLAHHLLGLALPGLSPWWRAIEQTTRQLVGGHPWLATAVLVLLAFELARAARALPWPPAERRAAAFLAGCLAVLFALHLTSVFVPRYLYVSVMFACVLLCWSLVRAVRARRMPRPLHLLRLGWVALSGMLVASLVLTSSLLLRGPMDKWRIASSLAGEVLASAERAVEGLPPGSRVGLVNLPYAVQTGYPLPVAPVLLEHSVQAWLDLRRSELRLEVVGLTYCTVDAREQDTSAGLPRIWVVADLRPDRRLEVRVLAAGEASRFPWDYLFAEDREGRQYRFLGPLRGPYLEVELLGEGWGAEPFFVVYLGDRVEARRGWTWRAISSSPLE